MNIEKPKQILSLSLGLLLGLAASTPVTAVDEPAEYTLQNGFISLHGRDGTFHSLRTDPGGGGGFGPNLIREFMIGAPNPGGLPSRSYQLEKGPNELHLRGLTVYLPERLEYDSTGYPRDIPAGQRVGVAFRADASFDRVGARFPTWHQHDSGATATLYRLAALPSPGQTVVPDEILGEVRLENITDNAWADMSFGLHPPGYYLVEISDVFNRVGWWGKQQDLYPNLVPVENRRASSNLDLSLRIRKLESFSGDWTLALDGNRLLSRFAEAAGAPASAVRTRILSAWDNIGYELDDFPFESFYGSTGQFILPHQLKRRPNMPQAGNVSWLRAVGKDGGDLRFDLSGPSPVIVWEMDPDTLHWLLSDGRLDITVLPDEGLPAGFPRFFSSDEAMTDLMTAFLLGHGFNLGAGTGVEWKEWQSLVLGWSDNAAKHGIASQLLSYNMTEDGYVYTWGDRIGWPFPFKDGNGDGLNDYDTRHFTTNANLISGLSRHVAWTRDVSYLRQALPRARLAMEYQLGPLQGANGLLIGNSPDQTGRNGAPGGNYWDLLPFGHKDAFANIYFYNSLARMAELEEMATGMLTAEEAAGGRAPAYYRGLMETVKQRFTETFWLETEGRFAGCVDIDGVVRDYGFTFINLEALAYGLGTEEQAGRIFDWLENGPTHSGEADTYSRWIFAPRATTFYNPARDASQTPRPTWRYAGWGNTDWETQVQDGGTILYISGYDLLARSRFLGAENVDQRMREILGRYAMPDRIMGGSPLYLGEKSQGGPGGSAGAVGVEGEFAESGVAPAAFLRTVLGIEAKPDGLHIKPDLPASLDYAGVENLSYAGELWRVTVTRDSVTVEPLDGDLTRSGGYSADEPFVFQPWLKRSPRLLLEDTFQQAQPGTEILDQPTSDGQAVWRQNSGRGTDVAFQYAADGEAVVFSPFSGAGIGSVYLDVDVDDLRAYAVSLGPVTLRGYEFGSVLLVGGRKGADETLFHSYELRPAGGTPESGPDFWALWYRPGQANDANIPVKNFTGSTVTFENLELRVVGDRQRLYNNGEPLDPIWRATQNKFGDGKADRVIQFSLNAAAGPGSYIHPVLNQLRLVDLDGASRAAEPLMAYEGFGYKPGKIIGRDGGSGWAEPYQQVFSRASPVLEPDGFEFEGLRTSGGHLFGSGNASVLRDLAMDDFDPGIVNSLGRVGAPGNAVWVSFLAQGSATSRLWSVAFYRNTSQVLYLGKASNETASWRLRSLFASGASETVFTGVPYEELGLWVMRFEFRADGDHAIHLFRNPDPAGGEPPLGAALASFDRTDLSFDRLRINCGDGLRLDEIRLGSSWGAVTPPELDGYEFWRREHFTEEELLDESISGDAVDPWGEGIANLLRYALGIDEPGVEGRARLPVVVLEPVDGATEGDRFLTITLERPKEREDVEVTVETSPDLSSWAPDAVLVERETLPDGTVSETYRDANALDETSRRYLRLRVRRK